MEKVKIYSTHQCPFCIMAKRFMDENKIKYENHFVDDNEKQREEMVKISGQLGVPVILIGDKVYNGFTDTGVKKELLKNKEK